MARDVTALGADNRPLLVALANSWRDFLSGNPTGTPDPSPGGAEITGLSPATAVHLTGPDLTVHATGTGFVKGFHQIQFAGQPRDTTWVSATDLSTLVKPSQQATAATVPVTVYGAEGSRNFVYT